MHSSVAKKNLLIVPQKGNQLRSLQPILETENVAVLQKEEGAYTVPEVVFVPGTVYCLKRNVDNHAESSDDRGREYFGLGRRHPGEHFQRIMLSSNLISDHRCDSHYYALRDVLKGLPMSRDEGISDRTVQKFEHLLHSVNCQRDVSLDADVYIFFEPSAGKGEISFVGKSTLSPCFS